MRRTLGTSRLLALTLTLALGLSACSSGGSPGGNNASPQQTSRQKAQTVTLAIASDEGTLTPFTNQTGYPGNNLVKLIFDTLAVVKGDRVVGLLANEIRTTDNQTFTMPLRSGVKWQDGKPFTAQDVVFSVKYYRKNSVGDSAIDVSAVKKVTATGNTVTMVLKAPDPEFPRMILSDMVNRPGSDGGSHRTEG